MIKNATPSAGTQHDYCRGCGGGGLVPGPNGPIECPHCQKGRNASPKTGATPIKEYTSTTKPQSTSPRWGRRIGSI